MIGEAMDRIVAALPLPQRLKVLLLKSREFVLYVVVGVMTTLLNGLAYCLGVRCGLANVPSTVVAWTVAVVFAFFLNKFVVFSSRDMALKRVLTEMAQFVGCRLGTGFIDVGIMYVSVDCWGWHGLLMKVISDFIVTLVNFSASKFFIFTKRAG